MRIEAFSALVAVVWLIAVLCTQLVTASNETLNLRKPRDHHLGGQFSRWESDETSPKRVFYAEFNSVLMRESGDKGLPVECCPVVEEMIEPKGGRNRQDMYVELYRDGENTQRFYEYSCRPDVLDKPCRFIDRKLQAQSRCVQRFSYTYAIVQNSDKEGEHHHDHYTKQSTSQQRQFPTFPGNSTTRSLTLDYIRIHSGCSCEITPKPKKRKLAAMKVKRTRSRGHRSARTLRSTRIKRPTTRSFLDYSSEM